MKNFFLVLLLSGALHAAPNSIPYISFDASMEPAKYPHVFKIPMYTSLYTWFKESYEKISPLKLSPDTQTRIPKIIHIIWLGSPFPEKYKGFMQSWIDHHPDWEFKLWTDRDVADFPMKNKAMFLATTNYGEKADIWRYEILEMFGGLYVDTDQECFKNFDAFNHTYDFYIGVQPLDTNSCQLGIGLIGSIPHHPILQHAIKELPKNKNVQQIIVKTGPVFFTKIFIEAAGRNGYRDIAFPASYFYPCNYYQKGFAENEWRKTESYAVHHWEGSWLGQ